MAAYEAEFTGTFKPPKEPDDESEDDEDEPEPDGVACPSEWFARTMEEVGLVELTGCSILEILNDMPLDMRRRLQAYKLIMDKAKPELEKIAADKSKSEGERERMKEGTMG